MSVTIEQTWVHRFHDVLMLTYQQMGSLLQNLIDPGNVHRDVSAAIDHFDRLGNVIANDVIAPFGPTVILNPEHSRRAVTLQSSDAAVLVSDEHTLRAMINPTNGYLRTIVAALGRRADKHIIDAALGSAVTAVITPGTAAIAHTGSVPLPSGQKVGAGTAWDLTRTIAAGELMDKAGIPNDASQRVMVYSPGQTRNIMAITQASSSDFTRNRIHDTGTVNGIVWEGFTWMQIPDVVAPDITVLQRMLPLVSTTRSCFAFHRGSIGLSIGRDLTTKINERPEINNAIQNRSIMMMGAGRLWEGGVVQVDALEN
jgi:hypothetical protein